MENEEWKKHPRLSDLEISSWGRIRTPWPTYPSGYRMVKARDNGRGYWNVNRKNKTFYVHRLVAEAFLGLADQLQVNHLDGNKSNNHLSNLCFVTASENGLHAVQYGLQTGKVNQEQIEAMQFMRMAGMTYKQIGEQIGLVGEGSAWNAMQRTVFYDKNM